ncbi:hypothetical protein F5884DRAFT_895035 [Xylogone sp. PMI_703]|nr:hypothetical protein F5884DRAFT_895035 [Xylogone sp. PMI_703]
MFIGLSTLTPLRSPNDPWSGFDERPTTERCYRQERTAMLLVLAVFKLCYLPLSAWVAYHRPTLELLCGAWSGVDCILWVIGGVYGTPRCPGDYGPGGEW